ncbi:phosphatidylglycerol lysyltransferase domain-containing protein [Planotetraspora sp. A-T 1434]|nr:phosphatidylglycerol lysyltransferase domain-containing protein [Planotetraspora sp. A-T 1434]MCT9928714.1 phosphatidylglycerol lysyltransferase domain-containing protein [Planotetraspora sp. A-T 1434]
MISRSWVPAAAGYTALVIGILDIIKGVVPHFRASRISEIASVLPGSVTTLAEAAMLLVGVLLIMLAHALRRRKVRAWRAVIVLLPLGAVVEALRWRHSIAASISVVLFVVLLVNRREFYALSDPRSRWRALWNFLALGAFDIVIGWVLVITHSRAMIGQPSLSDQLQHVLLGLFGLEGPIQYASERTGDLVYYSLAGLGALTAVTTLYLALRPERPAAALTPDDDRRLRALLDRYGRQDSLGYFALRQDKSVIFSTSGKAAIAYRVVAGVMLASGDPIGDVEAWPGAIKRFLEEARRHAWVPAVIGCSETGGEVWTREGDLSALELGDEAIVEVADFTLEGRAMRNVRQMVNRTERLGYICQVRRVGDLTEVERERIRNAADFWRGTETERGFSMALGRFGDPADAGCIVVTAHKDPAAGASGDTVQARDTVQAGDTVQARDTVQEGTATPGGDIRAVLHFVPWGPDGISLDLMRRDREADPGLNELLIVKALQAAPRLGVTRVSLNFAMFRSTLARGERLGAGPVLRAWRGILVFLSRWFQIESLYKFNAKFRPFWEPRFLVYPTARDLPRIGVSALQAEAFLTIGPPRPGAWLRGLRRGLLRRWGGPSVEVLGRSGGAVPETDGHPSVGRQVGDVPLGRGAGQPEPSRDVRRGDGPTGAAHGVHDKLGRVAGTPLPDRRVDAVALVQRPHGAVDLRLTERQGAAQPPVKPRVRAKPLGEVALGERLDQVVDDAAAERLPDDRGLGGGVGDGREHEPGHPADIPRVQVGDPEVVVHDEDPDHGAPPGIDTAPDR